VTWLLDTDVLSELARPRPVAGLESWLDDQPAGSLFTSVVVVGELLGSAPGTAGARRLRRFVDEWVLEMVGVLDFDLATTRCWASITGGLRSRGLPLPAPDLQIAATAIVNDLELVTGNLRHFERIPGLKLSRAYAELR